MGRNRGGSGNGYKPVPVSRLRNTEINLSIRKHQAFGAPSFLKDKATPDYVSSFESMFHTSTPTETCTHGTPICVVCGYCVKEANAKKQKEQYLAEALTHSNGDVRRALLETLTKTCELADENERLKSELQQALKREEAQYSQHFAQTAAWKQRAYNAESTLSLQQTKTQELTLKLLELQKTEQLRIQASIEELEMKEKSIPTQVLRKLDLE